MKQSTQLFNRYLNNECTPEEVSALIAHFGGQQDNEELKLLILEELKGGVPENFEQRPEVIAVFNQTDAYLKNQLFTEKRSSVLPLFVKYAAAACLAGMVFFSVYFYIQYNKPKNIVNQLSSVNDAQPGTNKAVLTLADGTSVALGGANDHTVLNDAGIKIKRTKDGTLVYEAGAVANDGETKYNQLTTPKGAQYEIILPDGTRAWLNASSSLRYPLAFNGEERRIQLRGEGYFEVEKVVRNGNHIPFFVETPTQIVQVLGTEFNISAYEDDELVRTTLISGKVNVQERSGKSNKVLSPGEQSILSRNNNLQVVKTNAENARAWKNGNFVYEDMYLKDILKQLSRWYDVDVDYTQVPQTRYNMMISRKETLQSVLNMLRKTGNIKFQLVNNVIKTSS
ncbi:FecR family protein [Pedobacter frigoris]|uniref:DUF4974 domain-containing protein n=1 Tax=Pedobacter frigoris TaxID=2571272 RepID=A0A4V5NYT2_9SPHI|nr:FecR family protein [Pedobacter frigoris]TKC03928.1 DUF4974 domain-containing protein [Pedobacter frigoris]